jgi:hypothetical protein
MPIPPTVGAFAIVPSNDLLAAVSFWKRLGFDRTGGDAQYIIMTGLGVHSTAHRGLTEGHSGYGTAGIARTDNTPSMAASVAIRPDGIGLSTSTNEYAISLRDLFTML